MIPYGQTIGYWIFMFCVAVAIIGGPQYFMHRERKSKTMESTPESVKRCCAERCIPADWPAVCIRNCMTNRSCGREGL
jgi:hypothetical protein